VRHAPITSGIPATRRRHRDLVWRRNLVWRRDLCKRPAGRL